MTWTTEAELAFVRALGRHRRRCRRCGALATIAEVAPRSRLALLRQYQAAMQRRADWGMIDPAKVAEEVARLLAALEAGGFEQPSGRGLRELACA